MVRTSSSLVTVAASTLDRVPRPMRYRSTCPADDRALPGLCIFPKTPDMWVARLLAGLNRPRVPLSGNPVYHARSLGRANLCGMNEQQPEEWTEQQPTVRVIAFSREECPFDAAAEHTWQQCIRSETTYWISSRDMAALGR